MHEKMPKITQSTVSSYSVDYRGDDGEETLVMTDWPSSTGWDVTVMAPDKTDIHFSLTSAQFAAMSMIAATRDFHLTGKDDD